MGGQLVHFINISTRAPAWGAMFTLVDAVSVNQAFQLALPRGERLLRLARHIGHALFQLALPRGERFWIKSL